MVGTMCHFSSIFSIVYLDFFTDTFHNFNRQMAGFPFIISLERVDSAQLNEMHGAIFLLHWNKAIEMKWALIGI